MRERQHEHERDLGAGDVGAAADREHLDAAGGTGRGVDTAHAQTVGLHRGEPWGGGDFLRSERERFDDCRAAAGQRRAQLFLRPDQPHFGRIKPRHARTHAAAPAGEVGLVMGEEIGVGGNAVGRRAWVEHDADDAQKAVVFHGQDRTLGGGHGAVRQAGSRSSSSACSTRAFML